MTPKEWAKEAVIKHGWERAFDIAIQCVNGNPGFFSPVVEYIKRNAPPGTFDERAQ